MIRDPKKHPHTKNIDLDKLREMREAGVHNYDIATHFNCSPAVVSRLALRLGCKRRTIDPTQNIPTRAIEALYHEGSSLDEIAKKLGCSRDFISRLLKSRGVKVRPQVRRHPDLVAECVRLRRLGMMFKDIATRLGLSYTQVRLRCKKVLGPGRHGGSRPGAGARPK